MSGSIVYRQMNRPLYVLSWAFVAYCTALVARPFLATSVGPEPVAQQPAPARPAPEPSAPTGNTGAEWFRRMKPYCNSVEVATVVSQSKPPATVEGSGYLASCFALAGRIDDARRVIDNLPARERASAAGIVFEVGHPVADAGDDRSAGPIMELVVDYFPSHYMALYHAGMAEYMLGQRDLARKNLEAFLGIYTASDGWTSNARQVLTRLADSTANTDARRPREP